MKAKARKTSTVLLSGTAVIVKKAARAPVTEIVKEVETAQVPATGERQRPLDIYMEESFGLSENHSLLVKLLLWKIHINENIDMDKKYERLHFYPKNKDCALAEKQSTSCASLSVFQLSPRLPNEYDHDNKQ